MRLFLFLFIVPTISFGQACTEADLASVSTISCSTLTISSLGLDRAGDGTPDPIIINVTGDVVINGDITLNGQDGSTFFADNQEGGFGGPGASPGGGFHGVPENGGIFTGDLENGGAGENDPALCGSGGGGGGGSSSPGQSGFACNGGSTFGSAGIQSSFAAFLGGFGGGAGGERGSFDLGGGGGGGGSIRIDAGGTITIANGVRISARGGRGGNSISEGGAGGGGGAGNIHLKSLVAINNHGILDVRGGDPGINTRSSGVKGGNGGRGGDGIIRIEVGASSSDYTGLQDFSNSSPISTNSSLKSDISCGTIAKNNDENLLFQMFVGFFAAFLIAFSIRRLLHIRIL